MRELEWTVDLFDELIEARIYMFRRDEAPSSVNGNSCVFILLVDMVEWHFKKFILHYQVVRAFLYETYL